MVAENDKYISEDLVKARKYHLLFVESDRFVKTLGINIEKNNSIDDIAPKTLYNAAKICDEIIQDVASEYEDLNTLCIYYDCALMICDRYSSFIKTQIIEKKDYRTIVALASAIITGDVSFIDKLGLSVSNYKKIRELYEVISDSDFDPLKLMAIITLMMLQLLPKSAAKANTMSTMQIEIAQSCIEFAEYFMDNNYLSSTMDSSRGGNYSKELKGLEAAIANTDKKEALKYLSNLRLIHFMATAWHAVTLGHDESDLLDAVQQVNEDYAFEEDIEGIWVYSGLRENATHWTIKYNPYLCGYELIRYKEDLKNKGTGTFIRYTLKINQDEDGTHACIMHPDSQYSYCKTGKMSSKYIFWFEFQYKRDEDGNIVSFRLLPSDLSDTSIERGWVKELEDIELERVKGSQSLYDNKHNPDSRTFVNYKDGSEYGRRVNIINPSFALTRDGLFVRGKDVRKQVAEDRDVIYAMTLDWTKEDCDMTDNLLLLCRKKLKVMNNVLFGLVDGRGYIIIDQMSKSIDVSSDMYRVEVIELTPELELIFPDPTKRMNL